jgi:hypothetical protein
MNFEYFENFGYIGDLHKRKARSVPSLALDILIGKSN